ncbi:MAG: hypothetical protein GWN00_01115 [Aliifodinibius sp.]|nr:hypothetical protein [Fodinibius sp.]NIV09931.1 hypothetical protein [Fodinibius sp.]NIY23461.1 hypothetical protein [Fodinibius sp.]
MSDVSSVGITAIPRRLTMANDLDVLVAGNRHELPEPYVFSSTLAGQSKQLWGTVPKTGQYELDESQNIISAPFDYLLEVEIESSLAASIRYWEDIAEPADPGVALTMYNLNRKVAATRPCPIDFYREPTSSSMVTFVVADIVEDGGSSVRSLILKPNSNFFIDMRSLTDGTVFTVKKFVLKCLG